MGSYHTPFSATVWDPIAIKLGTPKTEYGMSLQVYRKKFRRWFHSALDGPRKAL